MRPHTSLVVRGSRAPDRQLGARMAGPGTDCGVHTETVTERRDDPRRATEADLSGLWAIVSAAYRKYLRCLYTNEVMIESIAVYGRLGIREIGRHAEDGYRRVFMEKVLRPNQA